MSSPRQGDLFRGDDKPELYDNESETPKGQKMHFDKTPRNPGRWHSRASGFRIARLRARPE